MNGPAHTLCPLQELATRRPGGVFLVSPHEQLTFAEMESHVSEQIKIWGETLPRILCLHEPQTPADTVCQLLAGMRTGVPVALLNLRQPRAVRDKQMRWLDKAVQNLPSEEAESAESGAVDPAATVLFTSGSTGQPKAVVHRAGHHWRSAQAASRQAPLCPEDRWLCSLPLYHVGGLSILFRCLTAGAAVCFQDPGMSLSGAVREMKPSHLSLVPTQLQRLIRAADVDLSAVKRVLIGGAPLSESLLQEALEKGVPLATSYGMTETASQVAATPPGEPVKGSGRALEHAEIKISSKGEILLKAGSVGFGALTHQGLESLCGEDGWLHTGDVGRLEEGVLYVEGRLDNQFISGGENIQPEMIERALLEVDGITEAVVVPKEDEEFGHRPLAWVDMEITSDRVEQWNKVLRTELPGYMIPVAYRRLPELKGMKRNRNELKG